MLLSKVKIKILLIILHDLHIYDIIMIYLKVFIVFYEEDELGDTLQIMTVLQKPTKESFKTIVNLLPLKGVCPFP